MLLLLLLWLYVVAASVAVAYGLNYLKQIDNHHDDDYATLSSLSLFGSPWMEHTPKSKAQICLEGEDLFAVAAQLRLPF